MFPIYDYAMRSIIDDRDHPLVNLPLQNYENLPSLRATLPINFNLYLRMLDETNWIESSEVMFHLIKNLIGWLQICRMVSSQDIYYYIIIIEQCETKS